MKYRILIVDDEESIRGIYRRAIGFLNVKFFDALEASDATEATNILIRQKIDLVVLDLKMPYIDGRYMFEVIKEYDPELRVIVASVLPTDTQQRLLPDADEYFDKSKGAFKLLQAISRVLLPRVNDEPKVKGLSK